MLTKGSISPWEKVCLNRLHHEGEMEKKKIVGGLVLSKACMPQPIFSDENVKIKQKEEKNSQGRQVKKSVFFSHSFERVGLGRFQESM